MRQRRRGPGVPGGLGSVDGAVGVGGTRPIVQETRGGDCFCGGGEGTVWQKLLVLFAVRWFLELKGRCFGSCGNCNRMVEQSPCGNERWCDLKGTVPARVFCQGGDTAAA